MTGSGRIAARAGAIVAAAAVAAAGALGLLHAPQAAAAPAEVPGMDVSGHQGNVDWKAAWNAGARFAYVKATEGTGYRNPYFAQQYNGSYDVGMIRGAYHFARPDVSDGATQADYFVAHGGGWSADGRTMPPMLDIEYNPYGSTCFGLSKPAMVSWVKSFSERLHAKTSRWPMLYTTTDWWKTCTGNSAAFGDTHPLFIARYAQSAGPLPSGWRYYTVWQYSDSGNKPGDQDSFNGSMEQLIKLAGGEAPKSEAPAPPKPATSTKPPTSTKPTTSAPPTSSATKTPTSSATASPSTTTKTSPTTSSSPTSSATKPPASASSTAAKKDISGLVWAGGKQANPPGSLSDAKHADSLTARVHEIAKVTPKAPAVQKATTSHPTQTAAPETSQPQRQALAKTGVSTPRLAVFGAALLVFGAILMTLSRMAARR
ncbi:lysozyme [Amycolatopsis rubida]|uniref:Lysozyme n=1 Tax=Amycolatopsis rubida TaxID=112413 RepID=A0A1I5U483_9PSEU|nr:Lyzozyme M1 (1,4-beta-N-acetylmuramidase), GH25 family [Amycolatopsis rubida]